MTDWTQERERGSRVLMQLMSWLALHGGWQLGRALILPVTLYFFLTSRRARRASRGFLDRALGRPARWHEMLRHFHAFSAVTLDRLFFLTRSLDAYDVRVTGLEHLARYGEHGRGCLLLGSHLGSFEVLRALAEDNPRVRVRALMHEAGGATVDLFRALNPAVADKIIRVGNTGTMLQVKEAIDRGEIVGILGDRTARGDKRVAVPFLGAPAAFPVGPYVLSTLLETPIVLCFGLHRGGRRYDIRLEPFSDGARLPRAGRDAAIAGLAARYAARLEAQCRQDPFNWFNFYDFWAETER